jgi:hypothetical protein
MGTIKANSTWRRQSKVRALAKWTSLALTIVLVGLWITSRWLAVQYRYVHNFRTLGSLWVDGRFEIQWSFVKDHFIPESSYGWQTWRPDGVWNFDFRFAMETPTDYGLLRVPGCVPEVVTMASFMILLKSDRVTKQRSKAGKCVRCEYDRGGLSTDAKCPECGKP